MNFFVESHINTHARARARDLKRDKTLKTTLQIYTTIIYITVNAFEYDCEYLTPY